MSDPEAVAPATEVRMKALAADWIRAIRGKRSQALISRRLGYRSNVVYRWEAGVCFPSASIAFRLIDQCGGDVAAALEAFLPGPPDWLTSVDVTSPAGIARLLTELRGRIPLQELSAATSLSRFAISRWLKGHAQPSLPEFLLLVDKTSMRLLDFVASFTDPAILPSVSELWNRLVLSRKAAYEYPWSHAVLRSLELHQYGALPSHQPSWIADRLGISEGIERESLDLLLSSGQARWNGTHYVPTNSTLIDTRADPRRALGLKAWWTQLALERMTSGLPGLYSYNLCSVAKADLERIVDLQRKCFRQMTHIIANSTGSDHVVLYASQLLRLDSDSTRKA